MFETPRIARSAVAGVRRGQRLRCTKIPSRRRPAIAALALAAPALSVGVALAATAGDLDPSFDGDGKRILPFAATPGDVLVQPDGKIVVTDSTSFTVLRLNPDGSLDRGFGGDGVVAADFGEGARIGSAALQRDGKIVVAGETASDTIAVARFNDSGSLDATFDPGGPDGDGQKVYSDLQPSSPRATLVQRDGRIIIAGTSPAGITASRLTPSGAPDGTAFQYAGDDNPDFVHAAAVAPDGKIVVAGESGSTAIGIVVARFNTDGSLDKSLAGSGRTELDTTHGDIAVAVLVQPDGKIVLAGESNSAGRHMIVTRLDAGGAPDATFAGDGTAAPDFVGQSDAVGATLQSDGKILVGGTSYPTYQFAVARLAADGALDPTFGLDGKTTIPFENAALAYAAGAQPDGRFVIAGLTLENGTSVRTALARVLADQPPVSAGPGPGPAAGLPGRSLSMPRCAGKRATIVGSGGRDTLRGTPRADVIVALAGNDRVSARGGKDLVCGGPGNDRLAGGPGADRLTGHRGRDLLSGGPGHDRLAGGPQRDRCVGGAARDRASACEIKHGL